MKVTRFFLISGVSLISSLVCGLTAERFLKALHPEATAVLLLYLWIVLAPQVSMIYRKISGVYYCFFALLLGMIPAVLIVGGSFGACLVAGAFVAMILAFARSVFLLPPYYKRTLAMVLTIFFFSSFYWTGLVFNEDVWINLAVWLSPQAMISVACENFSFAHLPDVYNIWLGPMVPLPSSWWLAMTYYLVPALMLLELNLLCKRIWRNA